MPHDIEDVFAACKLTLFPRIARRFSRRPAAVRTGRTPASTSPPRRRLLHPRRTVRREPVPDLRLARTHAARTARRTARTSERGAASTARTHHSDAAPIPPLERGNDDPIPLHADDANFWGGGPGPADYRSALRERDARPAAPRAGAHRSRAATRMSPRCSPPRTRLSRRPQIGMHYAESRFR